MASTIGWVLSPGLSLVGSLLKKKPKPAPVPVAPPQARTNTTSVLADSFARRRGTGANRRTGSMGAEATGGVKTALGA